MERRITARLAVAVALLAGCDSGGGRQAPTDPPRVDAGPGHGAVPPKPPIGLERLPPGVVAAIRTPGFPVAIGFGHGSVWVAAHRATTVYRIDPQTNRVQARIDVARESCGRVRVSGDAVWVVACEDGPSTRIDPATNQAVETTDSGVFPPLAAAGRLWQVRSDGLRSSLTRLTPRTPKATARIRVGPLPGPGLAAFGAVWVPASDGTITRVDTTHARARVIALGAADTDLLLARAAGAIWAADGLDGSIWRIAPRGRARRTSLRVRPPSLFYDIGLAGGRGRLFLRSGDTRVLEIEPRTMRITARYPATGAGGHVGVGFGSLWVANAGEDSVWRIRLR